MRHRVFTFVLTDGGTADLFWGYIAIFIGMMLVYASAWRCTKPPVENPGG